MKLSPCTILTLAIAFVGACAEPSVDELVTADPVEDAASELLAAPGNSIAAGRDHTCAIVEGGSVKCWGLNTFGQLGIGSTALRGAAAGTMSNALPTVSLGRGLTAKALAGGQSHTCAILSNNLVKCWGANDVGQLGVGDTLARGTGANQMGDNLPYVDLGLGRTAKALAAGNHFTCAILDTNQLKCWGQNNFGQLGVEDTLSRGDQATEMGDALPTVFLGAGRTVTAVNAGPSYACALLDTGDVKCWGSNFSGELGLGHTQIMGDQEGEMAALPIVDLGTGLKAKAIGVGGGPMGGGTTCALITSTNQVKCWGEGYWGQFGNGVPGGRGTAPGQMGNAMPAINLGTGVTVQGIYVAGDFVCAHLATSNQVKCWGNNGAGQLGLGDLNHRGDAAGEMGDSLPLVALGTGRSVRALDLGMGHSCAILDNNQVKCWGYAVNGALGYGSTVNRGDNAGEMGDALPVVQMGSRAAVFAAAGFEFACARLANGQLKCWGYNNLGQLGLGDGTNRGVTAATIGDGLPAVDLGVGRTVWNAVGAIAAGESHTCVVLDTRRVKCWGRGDFGQLGLGYNLGAYGGLPGQMGDTLPPIDLGAGKLAVQVAAGQHFSCARLTTGEVKCWGYNANGQLGLGDALPRGYLNDMGAALPAINLGTGLTATQIAAGRTFACALVTGGLVKCWGDGAGAVVGNGVANVGDAAGEMAALAAVPLGTGLTAKAITAGGNHACAWLSNNQVKCWGDNGAGQLGQGDATARRAAATLGDALPVINLGAGRTAKGVTAADRSTCVLLDTNQVKCFGDASVYALGLSDTRTRGDGPGEMGDSLPTLSLGTGRSATALFAGPLSTSPCAATDDKLLRCWGRNLRGELGVGNTTWRGGVTGDMGDNLRPADLGSEQ
jgi:alpha-tubulin suppressor-like RCC1 family protein